MKMLDKHKSKLHKGFEKQVRRQDAKPDLKYIQLNPVVLSWDDEEGEYKPLQQNNKTMALIALK